MKKSLFAASVLAFTINTTAFAQEEPVKKEDQKKESEEVIIRNKGGKDMKLTVEINGDSVTVNGKPLSEFENDQVTIDKRKIIIRDGDDELIFIPGQDDNDFNFDKERMKREFKRQWKEEKDETIAFLGVTSEKSTEGIKVIEVVKGSAAEKAGLKKDDIITKIDDKEIKDPEGLSEYIRSKKPKDAIKINYSRAGKKNIAKASLGERKEKRSYAYSFDTPPGMMRSFKMPPMPPMPPDVEELDNLDNPELFAHEMVSPHQKKIGLKIQDMEESSNVKVIEVEEGSAAEKAGLKKDDIIIEIDGTKITNTDEARIKLHPEEGKNAYKIKATRNGKEMNFDVKIPKKIKTANL